MELTSQFHLKNNNNNNHGFVAMKVHDENSISRGKKEQLSYHNNQKMISSCFLEIVKMQNTPSTWPVLWRTIRILPLCHHSSLPFRLIFQVQHYTLYVQKYLIWTNKHCQLLKGIWRKEKFLMYSQYL